jgi:hypothetical protein
MLIQLLTQHPEALGRIVQQTPAWVWGLLAALLVLGISQLRSRTVGLRRMLMLPTAMLGLGLYGLVSAFGGHGQMGAVLAVWLLATSASAVWMLQTATPAGTRFDAALQSFVVPGSAVPLLLILGIFMTKYIVGIELALQPAQASDTSFVLPVALLYGVFNGVFAGRALRLLRLVGTHRPAGQAGFAKRLFPQRDPW